MDSCSTASSRESEESECDWSFDSKKKKPPESAKNAGYQRAPDGEEWLSEDDSDAPPQVRTQDERRSLLGSATAQSASFANKMPVTQARSSGFSSTSSLQNLPPPVSAPEVDDAPGNRRNGAQPRNAEKPAVPKKNTLRNASESSSLVSESSEHGDSSPRANQNPPKNTGPDWKKQAPSVSPAISDGAHRLPGDTNTAVPPARRRNDQRVSQDSQGTGKTFIKSKKIGLPKSSSPPVTSARPDPLSPYGGQASSKAGTSQKEKKVPATEREYIRLRAATRRRAKRTEIPSGYNRFEFIFTNDKYKHIDDKSKIHAFLGYKEPIYSKNTPDKEQQAYYDEVCRLFILNYGKPGRARLDEINDKYRKFATRTEKVDYRNEVLNNLMWKLTPNQRHGLREEFKSLYGNSTLADDTNWMFFDTIIRSSEPDHGKQLALMKEVFSAPKETRLDVRYSLQKEYHGYLSKEQREDLKRVCQKRYKYFLYSRLPLIQVIIREKNELALRDYLDTVEKYVPPELHYLFLIGRRLPSGDTLNDYGDPAFFAVAESGNRRMLQTYLDYVLRSKHLALHRQYAILSAERNDGVSAFHLIMASGNFPLARTFVITIIRYFQGIADYFSVHDDTEITLIPIAGKEEWVTRHKMILYLIKAYRKNLAREYHQVNGYTTAIELGHKKFAKKFRHLIKPLYYYIACNDRSMILKHFRVFFDEKGNLLPPTEKQMEKDRKHARELAIGESLKNLTSEQEAEERRKEEEFLANCYAYQSNENRILKARIKADEDGVPRSTERTHHEIWSEQNAADDIRDIKGHTHLAYLHRDQVVLRETLEDRKRQKRKDHPSPLRSAAKTLRASLTPLQPHASPTPEKKVIPRMPSQHSPSPYHPENRDILKWDKRLGPKPDKKGYMPVGDESEGG